MSILPCQKGRKKHQQNCRLSNNKGSLASAVVHNSNRLWRRDQDRTGSMASLALLIALVLCLGGRTALCDLSLKVPHETQGVRGDSVVIPCTYTPSARYTEHEVHWYADDVKIISRFDSQSHILKADFEGRLKVADTRAGDVSLTIKNLRTIERADYRCEVIWKSSDGFVTKQGISKLMVLRVRPATVRPATVRPATVRPATQKPEVNIGTSKIDDMNRATMGSTKKPNVPAIITGGRATVRPTTKKPEVNIVTMNRVQPTTKKPKVITVTRKVNNIDEATVPPTTKKPEVNIVTMNRVQPTTKKPKIVTVTRKVNNIDEVTSRNTAFPTNRKSSTARGGHTTGEMGNSQKSQIPVLHSPKDATETAKLDYIIKGSGVPLYIILLIALVCALSICTLIIVFITRRNKNAYYSYNMPTMAQLAMRQEGSAPIAFGEYSSCACQTPQTENDYHPCKQMPETEYEVMAAQASNEYELLIPEREVLPSCSALTEPNPAVPPSPRSTFLK
ncbi:V-set and immunoglobulin domain-containing protein 4 isoform X3 [Xenopus tropicalis]|uniref:V-set and immunoglobulin domain-containing protein 4 isoform X3 n=1 Tax=Xenopus tropicalis TaxID=8364 RepID=UPI0012F6DDEB|nr:V-set and immunoglobulin domain-containing protein 4 isoform X3 [Xenopus tropicalis]